MLQAMMQAVCTYFEVPLPQTSLFYSEGKRIEMEGNQLAFYPVAEGQPLDVPWEILLMDTISPQLGYVHVGYSCEDSYCHEILTFLRVASGCKLVCVLRVQTPSRYSVLTASIGQEGKLLQEVSQILLTYGHAVYSLDAEKALSVFASDVRMIHPVDSQTFADVSCEVFKERWAGLPSPEERNLREFTRIYHIELLDAETAVAKVGVAKLTDYYNDYLFCRKTDAGWKIVQKLTQLLWQAGSDSEK